MCQCPDGSYASIYGCPSHSAPAVPSDRVYCSDTGGSCSLGQTCCGTQCCNAGNFCSRFGCVPQGVADCGSYWCHPGQTCMTGNKCMPLGNTDCRNGTTCAPGYVCSRGHGCIPENAADCGGGIHCPSGNKCSADKKRCMSLDAIDCGSHSCSAGQKCGSGNTCLARDAVDCGGGRSCTAGNKCTSDNKCIPKDYADCGHGLYCPSGNKCSRGGGCVPQNSVDCGKGNSCPQGRTCGSNNQCLAAGDVDCRNGTSCPKGNKCTASACIPKDATLCAGGSYCEAGKVCFEQNGANQCLTPQQAKTARQAQQQAAQQKLLDDMRKGIGANKPSVNPQTLRPWNAGRMREARPLPLLQIDREALRLIPAAPRGGVSNITGDRNDEGGQKGSGPSYTTPLKWAGRLFFRSPAGDQACSAQFISPRIILTAAHCVRDSATGSFYENIAFALQYHNNEASRRYTARCVATPDKWVGSSPQNYPWDYALILTDQSLTGHFGWEVNWDGAATAVAKIGYPAAIASGEVIQVDHGPATMNIDGSIIQLRHGNPKSTEGGSGGAWVERYSNGMDRDANRILTVTSFLNTSEPEVAYGPYLNEEFNRLLLYVKDGCP
jgi:hypothetical protein